MIEFDEPMRKITEQIAEQLAQIGEEVAKVGAPIGDQLGKFDCVKTIAEQVREFDSIGKILAEQTKQLEVVGLIPEQIRIHNSVAEALEQITNQNALAKTLGEQISNKISLAKILGPTASQIEKCSKNKRLSKLPKERNVEERSEEMSQTKLGAETQIEQIPKRDTLRITLHESVLKEIRVKDSDFDGRWIIEEIRDIQEH